MVVQYVATGGTVSRGKLAFDCTGALFSRAHDLHTVDAHNDFWEGLSMDEAGAMKEVSSLVDFIAQVWQTSK